MFNQKFKNKCTIEEAYNFAKEYLLKEEDINAKYVILAFNKISFEKWNNAAKNCI